MRSSFVFHSPPGFPVLPGRRHIAAVLTLWGAICGSGVLWAVEYQKTRPSLSAASLSRVEVGRTTRTAGSPALPHEGVAAPRIGRGSPAKAVLALLGRPSARAGDAVWIYRDFPVAEKQAVAPTADTLLVIFEENRVDTLRLVSGDAVDGLLAHLQSTDG